MHPISLQLYVQVDEAVVRTIINVLTAEEQTVGLQQPSGIGQRPRQVAIDCYPSGKFLNLVSYTAQSEYNFWVCVNHFLDSVRIMS